MVFAPLPGLTYIMFMNSEYPAQKTFEEVYCAHHRCTAQEFSRGIFWLALHRHALPLAPLLLWGKYFAADRELIVACGRARSMRQIREEIEQHGCHPHNVGWLRQRCAIRISIRRLHRLARNYLPGSSLPLPFTVGMTQRWDPPDSGSRT
jgi:hypothetical protein